MPSTDREETFLSDREKTIITYLLQTGKLLEDNRTAAIRRLANNLTINETEVEALVSSLVKKGLIESCSMAIVEDFGKEYKTKYSLDIIRYQRLKKRQPKSKELPKIEVHDKSTYDVVLEREYWKYSLS